MIPFSQLFPVCSENLDSRDIHLDRMLFQGKRDFEQSQVPILHHWHL